MQQTILNTLKDRYQQQSICIVQNDYKRILASDQTMSLHALYQLPLQASQTWLRLSPQEVVFPYTDFFIWMQGEASFDETEAYQFFQDQEMWINLLLDYDHKKQDDEFLYLLMHTAKTLASEMYQDDILEVVIQSVVEAVQFADTGFLFLYDSQIEKLLVQAAIGFREESYKKTRLKTGEGVSGRVFEKGEPIIINGKNDIRQAMNNMSPTNHRYYVEAIEHRQERYPDCMMSVPLRFQHETIGVLTIDSFEANAFFTDSDLLLLETLADHVAIVITHARLYKNERKKREAFEQTLQALRQEHERMQRTTDFHHRLTNIAARGEGAEAIVNTLKQTVPSPFIIYDALLQPYYMTEVAETKSLPPRFLHHPRVQDVMKTHKWQIIPLQEEKLIVLPIIGVESIWGFMCVWTEEDQLAKNDIVLFEYGATVLSLELTKEEAIQEAELRAKGELVEGILSGQSPSMLEVQASNLGLDLSDYYVMILGRLPSDGAEGMMPEHIKRSRREAVQFLENEVKKRDMNGIISMNRSYIFAMISFSEQAGKANARDQMKAFADTLNAMTLPIQLGIGRVYKHLSNVNQSYVDAEKCLELLGHNTDQRVISFINAGIYRFLLQHSNEELRLFIEDILGPLLQYDEKKNGELMKTLAAYVKYDKDLKTITDALNIHHNTLYYRVNRIQDILDMDVTNTDEWFNVQLAYHVYQFLNNHNR
ncbi:GAF domain-containing protein [Thalassobacillus sp. CUG 92003]|uniref:helix-turn-helix domain-containing protein n=1 Tax=Thalassobacillus sp. CUG 92003 TaxID=2736641 RepID=UPI0015E7777E|nr:GAF domain-containing protein [Thalassobacillus sp. CUG 92003]